MKTFNFNRFSQALKCQFLVLRKTWIRLFGIFTLVMFMADLFFTRVQGMQYDTIISSFPMKEAITRYTYHVQSTVTFGVIFFCFSMLFGASFLFSGMKDTRKRSAFLLWPVSNLEKYTINLLLSIVWLAVITIGAYLLADALRMFVDWLTGRFVIWGPALFERSILGPAPEEHWQMAWMLFAWVLYPLALYCGWHPVPSPAVPADQLHDRSCRHLADNASEPDRLEQHEHRVHYGYMGREDRNLYAYFPSLLLYSEHSSDLAYLRSLLDIL